MSAAVRSRASAGSAVRSVASASRSASSSASVGSPAPAVGVGRPVDVVELRAGAVEQLGDERRGALLDGRAAVGREDQAVLRPGHRDVQEAALLVGVDVADGDGLAQELGREEAAAVLAGRPLPVEQARDDDVRELEALGLVEGHQPDALDVLGQLDARRQLAAGVAVGVEVGDEAGQRAVRVGALPVAREAQEAGDVGDAPLGLERADGDQVEDLAGPLDEPLEDRERALAPGQRRELLEGRQEAPELGPGVGRDGGGGRRLGGGVGVVRLRARRCRRSRGSRRPGGAGRSWPSGRRGGSRARRAATGRRSSSGSARRRRAGRRWPAATARGRGSPAARTATARRRPCTGCPRRAAGRRSRRGACACGRGRRRPTSAAWARRRRACRSRRR